MAKKKKKKNKKIKNVTRRKSVTDYKKYLNSKHWRQRRENLKRKKGDKFICFRCKSSENVQIHHRTYANLYGERKEDLILLCGYCHEEVHQLVKEGKVKLYYAHLCKLSPDKYPFSKLDYEYINFVKDMSY